jgi:hypothetical protein
MNIGWNGDAYEMMKHEMKGVSRTWQYQRSEVRKILEYKRWKISANMARICSQNARTKWPIILTFQLRFKGL